MLQEINPAVKVDQLEGHHGRSKRVSDQEQTSRTKRRGRGRRREGRVSILGSNFITSIITMMAIMYFTSAV